MLGTDPRQDHQEALLRPAHPAIATVRGKQHQRLDIASPALLKGALSKGLQNLFDCYPQARQASAVKIGVREFRHDWSTTAFDRGAAAKAGTWQLAP